MTERLLRDQAARDRIRAQLDTNFLVEAGAGSGKTTELLHRLVNLIVTGKGRVGEIAAVTFTRKAAAELRERFQTAIERELEDARQRRDHAAVALLDAAVLEVDRAFIGTIHSFCGRLLRERPIDAGLDPSFRELYGVEEERLRRDAWHRHLERLTNFGDPSLEEIKKVNLEFFRLERAYAALVENPDVDFPADEVSAPGVGGLREELERILDAVAAIMPEREPAKGWGNLQKKLLHLASSRLDNAWSDKARFLDALEIIVGHKVKPTYNRWPDEAAIRAIEPELEAFCSPEGGASRALRGWQAYRYGIALRFARRAAATFERERRRAGLVSFNDLLMKSAELLREHPAARRDLANRYRYLLVDEFQDTDPIQAEIVFLLAAADPDATDWRTATPRPGSLFVVGDPKQSIYRFRRADIAFYNQVKRRFRDIGAVLELTTNFRSRPPIETFVNSVSRELFPAEANEHQAAFAPLNVDKPDADQQGVFWYEVGSPTRGHEAVAEADSAQVASWIAARVDAGERSPGDFMLLAYRKQDLKRYATALEARNIPVQVTGAGVDIADELDALIALLSALADPDNPVLTVAALAGLFFGIDLEQLATHRLEHPRADGLGSGVFDFRRFETIGENATPVETALHQLCSWWIKTRDLPADVVVGTIVNYLGLLPYLAGAEAGESNAGALVYVMNAVRRAALDGDTSLAAALEALQEALDADEAEAPLRPGRSDAVRIMNLHKAKGLQAPVVILAHPVGMPRRTPSHTIERPPDGDPAGYLVIEHKVGWSSTRIAAPTDWDERVAAETPFTLAEYHRLLYVAATRAEEELVIAFCDASKSSSPWKPFYEYFHDVATPLDMPVTDPPERRRLRAEPDAVVAAADTIERERRARTAASYDITSVTKLVKHDTSIFAIDKGGLGRAWGNAVHQALEAANRGAGTNAIAAICRTALLDNDLPIAEDGEPEDLEDLVGLVERVRSSETWRRAQAADAVLVEAPFALPASSDGSVATIVEGVIDLAFQEHDGWVVVDYKTDIVDDPENLEARRQQYRAQVEAYAECFEKITGGAVKERQLLWVGMGLAAEAW